MVNRAYLITLTALLLCAFIVPETIEAKAMDTQANCRTAIHFVVTDVAANVAPVSIVIERADYPNEQVLLERITGNVAHYTTTNLLGVPMRRAWTYKPPMWGGQFNLSCAPTAVTLTAFSAASLDARTLLGLWALAFAALILLAWYALKRIPL